MHYPPLQVRRPLLEVIISDLLSFGKHRSPSLGRFILVSGQASPVEDAGKGFFESENVLPVYLFGQNSKGQGQRGPLLFQPRPSPCIF